MSIDRDCLACGNPTYELVMTGGCSHSVILECPVCGFWKSKRTKRMVYRQPGVGYGECYVPEGCLLVLEICEWEV